MAIEMESSAPAAGFFDSAPMAVSRTEGWRYFREPGEVYQRDGLWFITTARAVRFVHQHPEIFSSAHAFDNLGSPVPLIPLEIDPPEHVRYRRMLDPMFAPRVINQIDDELRQQVRDIIGRFIDRGRCEIMADLAELYPTQVILTMFGLPLADRDKFHRWVRLMVEASGATAGTAPTPEQAEGANALFSYLREYIQAKRANPTDDALSTVLAMSGDDAWSDDEVLGLCFMFALAGLDTVTGAIGFVMHALATRPDLRQRIAAEPGLTAPFIEEVLRLESPAPFSPRIVVSDVDVFGTTIPAGSYIFMLLSTANRDEREVPDDIDLDHADRGHVSFGAGIHRCVGSHLARRELRLVVEEFNKMIPDYEIDGDATPVIHWPSGTFHLTSLPLRFPPGGTA